MSDKPIPFSGPMVRAIIQGRKTQTRRMLNHQDATQWFRAIEPFFGRVSWHAGKNTCDGPRQIANPDYSVGDRLWVREAWKAHSTFNGIPPRDIPKSRVFYLADNAYSPSGAPGRPGMFMPRWASRLTLIVTDVRVQRLQEISEADARAEGIRMDSVGAGTFIGQEGPRNLVTPWPTAREAFAGIWDSLAKPGATWADNPWIVAISFEPHHCNIDAMEARRG